MPVNRNKPSRWKADIAKSVDMYNDWFMNFAPDAFRSTRILTTERVEAALKVTNNLTDISPETLRLHPEILSTLRMSTCPPLAVDRLIGLARVSPGLVKFIEKEKRIQTHVTESTVNADLQRIADIIRRMADPDIFVWLGRVEPADETEVHRAATIVADRLCGSVANPIIRNAQERRQLAAIERWLQARGYAKLIATDGIKFDQMPPATFGLRMNVPVRIGLRKVNIPVDVAIAPRGAQTGDLPIFLEAKSAGDYANVNKRRKEEAAKMSQLKSTYGRRIKFNLFLCGYFDSGYLGYEAAEGIDWVWEHRIDDLEKFGL